MAVPEQLTPFTSENAAEMGARGGRAKAGSKHLSTLIREVGENIDWDKTTLKNKDQMKALYGNNGWVAVVYVAMTKAMAGDAHAMRWLADNGYGKNIDITTNGKDIVIPILGGMTQDVYSNDSNEETN